MKPAKKPKSKAERIVRVKAFGAFDKYIKLPHSVERDPSVFSEWILRNLAIRPITITYKVSKEPANGK